MTNFSVQKELLKLEDKLYSYALALTKNKEDARDLVQDTNLRVLNNQDKFEFVDRNSFVGWVVTMMKNLFINHYNKVVTFPVYALPNEEVYSLASSYYTNCETIDNYIEVDYILGLLNSLENEYRIPLELLLAGYNYSEISEKLSLPLGTIKSRLFMARKKLDDQINKY